MAKTEPRKCRFARRIQADRVGGEWGTVVFKLISELIIPRQLGRQTYPIRPATSLIFFSMSRRLRCFLETGGNNNGSLVPIYRNLPIEPLLLYSAR